MEDLSTSWVLDTVRKMNNCCEKCPGMGWHTRPELGALDQLGDLGQVHTSLNLYFSFL